MSKQDASWRVQKMDGDTMIVDSQGSAISRVFAASAELAGPDWYKQVSAKADLLASAPDLLRELAHLVRLLEPLEQAGTLNVPGLATLNGARAAIARATGEEPR